ncbi:MAG: hypothetical protein IPH13_17140 [Planctomycetes bacterium]|nr:hypothetical protein [Planctomycetota bacterium]MCC7173023.1 hypothetical protein [Planctomycetota bacterium]
MSPVNPRRSRSASFGVGTLAVLVGGACVLVLGTWVAVEGGVPEAWARLPGFERFAHAKESAPAGKIAVPVSARAIKAYARISRDDVWDPNTNQITVVYLDATKLGDDVITDFAKVRGRVLAKDKSAGYVFSENDFLPEGTRAGLVAGIPAGKRGVRVELEQVPGLYGLNPGDRFDLMATLPIDTAKAQQQLQQLGGVVGRAAALTAGLSGSKQASVHCVVQNGVIVSGVEARNVPYTITTLTQGTQVKSRPVQEVVIAVAPEEVAALEQALAIEAAISCVPRSGRPDDPQDSRTPERAAQSPFTLGGSDGDGLRLIETIKGTTRELVPVQTPTRKPGS